MRSRKTFLGSVGVSFLLVLALALGAEARPSATVAGGSVSWALNAEPSSLDWVYDADFNTGQVMANLCDGLLQQQPNFSLRPALASSFSNPNPTTWRYQIRSGASFSDGNPLTAADVVYSLQRNMNKKVGSFWSGAFQNVKSIKATGPSEVTVTLKRPDSLFNSYMATPAGIVGEARVIQKDGKAYGTPTDGVSCVGPFTLGSWSKGQSITLKANPNYWDKAHVAHIASIRFDIVRDPATLTSALLSGTINGSYFLPSSSLKRLSSTSQGKMYYGKSTQGFNAIVMNTEAGLKDPRIRQALSMSIDRSAIIQAVLSGAAAPQRAPAVPGTWGYSKVQYSHAYQQLVVTKLNLEKAKQLVAAAGAPATPITVAVTSSVPQTLIIGDAIQSAGQSIGLNVKIKQIPPDQYDAVYTDKQARAGIDLYLTGWGTDFADPLQMYSYFHSGNFYNFSGYANPTLDKLLNQAVATSNAPTKARLVIGAQRIVVSQLLWIPLYAPYNTLFMSKGITGAPASYVQLHYPWAADLRTAS